MTVVNPMSTLSPKKFESPLGKTIESPQKLGTLNTLAIRHETVEKANDSILGESPSP